MDRKVLVLSTSYYPPVQYIAEIVKSGEVLIEQHETYPKQTYRNRCYIYSANGVLPLSIPVERGSFHRVKLKDLRLDNTRKWQREHLNAIRSAYNSAAFFEFYSEQVLKPLGKKYDYLIDLNMDILDIILGILEIDISVRKTGSYIKEYGENCLDMRTSISPKVKNVCNHNEYFQVFSPVHGFKANLSIIDLLFNMGPESWTCLRT